MNEARCSVNWKMYAPSGLLMQFTIREDDPDLHLPLLDAYLEALHLRGYTITEPGLDAGEKREEVNAYVIGETKKGDACVYLYSSKTALQWRIATVYVERFGELPFWPDGKKWEASAAPERNEADRKGFLNVVSPFNIVLEAQEPDAEGKVHWRFARVLPFLPDGKKWEASAAPAVPGRPLPPPESDAEFGRLTSATEERSGKHADMPAMAAMQLGTQTAQFTNWCNGFARIFPYYARQGKPDMAHIMRAIAAEGFANVTPDNLIAVCEALETRAERQRT